MAEYSYIFGPMRNESIQVEIPLYGTYCDLELNVGGRFDGSFSLDMSGKRNTDLIDATIPGRSWIVVIRDGNPIWGGFVWSRTYQSQSKDVQLFGQSWEKYPMYQLLRTDIDVTDEQQTIFLDLWTQMMTEVAGRDVNIILPSAPISPIVTKSLQTLGTDFKYYGELMSSLADATDGFDWTIDITLDGTNFAKTLRIGYPQLGSAVPGPLIFDYPGPILNYYATESMTTAGTNIFTLGAGTGTSMVTFEAKHDDMITLGWPRWDVAISRKDITDQGSMNSVGAANGSTFAPPMLVVKPTQKGSDGNGPDFGSFGLGDACILAIKDPRFPDGKVFQSRITKWMLNPQSAANVDSYDVLFENDNDAGGG